MILRYMKVNLENPVYHILLILTDGCIHDLRETVDLIVACSVFPLSIIIVGIGEADFSTMRLLDGDEHELTDGYGVKMERDIAQFVELKEFIVDGKPNLDRLAADVLGEVPQQLVDYMTFINHKPGDKIDREAVRRAIEIPTQSYIIE